MTSSLPLARSTRLSLAHRNEPGARHWPSAWGPPVELDPCSLMRPREPWSSTTRDIRRNDETNPARDAADRRNQCDPRHLEQFPTGWSEPFPTSLKRRRGPLDNRPSLALQACPRSHGPPHHPVGDRSRPKDDQDRRRRSDRPRPATAVPDKFVTGRTTRSDQAFFTKSSQTVIAQRNQAIGSTPTIGATDTFRHADEQPVALCVRLRAKGPGKSPRRKPRLGAFKNAS